MKANSIEDALNLFDPHHPLFEEDDLKAYYVSRADSPIEEMKTVLKTATDFPKLLFSGPPGCGKSTELGQLKEALKKDFHVILFSIREISNSPEVSLDGMLYHILSKIADKAKEEKLPIYQEKIDRFLRRGLGWETTIESSATRKGLKELEADFKAVSAAKDGGDIDYVEKYVFKTVSKPGLDSILDLINATVWDLEEKTKKDVLVLVTDIDKANPDQVRDLFTKSILYLTKLNCFAVYTFPIELKYRSDFIDLYRQFTGIYFLPNFMLYDRHGVANSNSQKQLREIVERRISPKLIYDDAVDMIVELSGGVVFELIHLVRQCCIVSLMEKIKFIDDEVVKLAEERIRKMYRMVYSQDDRKLLLEIHRDKKFIKSDGFFKLFRQFSFSEYGSGEDVWYDVNPILRPFIQHLVIESTHISQGGSGE